MSYSTELRQRFHSLAQVFPGYEPVLTQILFALLAREHVLLYSRPGRAKSQIAGSVFDMFSGAPVFRIQITKDTVKDSIFGNVIADDLLKTGREVYNLDGGIVTAIFAYLDEFFDGPDYLLRALLNVMNEREFHSKDMGTVVSPLHSIIATTNFMRQSDVQQAVLDRFMCKAVVQGIDGVVDSMRASETYLTYSGKAVKLEPLDYTSLKELADLVGKSEAEGGLVVSPGIRLLHVMLVTEFQRRRVEAAKQSWKTRNPDAVDEPTEMDLAVPDISPRTLVKLHDFSRASAVLDDRMAVEQNDLRALIYGLAVIGDQSGDETLWATVCDELLGLSTRQLKLLEDLGQTANMLAQLKAERSKTTDMQMRVGGQLYTLGEISSSKLRSLLTGSRHRAITMAVEQLTAEANALLWSQPVTYDLLKGWQR